MVKLGLPAELLEFVDDPYFYIPSSGYNQPICDPWFTSVWVFPIFDILTRIRAKCIQEQEDFYTPDMSLCTINKFESQETITLTIRFEYERALDKGIFSLSGGSGYINREFNFGGTIVEKEKDLLFTWLPKRVGTADPTHGGSDYYPDQGFIKINSYSSFTYQSTVQGNYTGTVKANGVEVEVNAHGNTFFELGSDNNLEYDGTWDTANEYLGLPTVRIEGWYGANQNCDLTTIVDGNGEPPIPPEPPQPDDPYPDDPEPPQPPHGPETPDPIPIPPLPPKGAVSTGLVTLYEPSLSQLEVIAGDMYSTNFLDVIKNYFANPMDILVGLMLLPCRPAVGGAYKPKIGNFTFSQAMQIVTSQWHEVDCGSLYVKNWYGSAFDYTPYTKAQIWLPYIGYVDLNVDEIMGRTLNVKYHVDVLTGNCTSFVQATTMPEVGPGLPYVIGQYSGNCGVQIPFARQSFDEVVSSAINMMTTIAASAAGGAAASSVASDLAAEGAIKKAAATSIKTNSQIGLAKQASSSGIGMIGNVMGAKPSYQRNGAAGATAGMMSIQYPYLILEVPMLSIPEDYAEFRGYPCNKKTTLGALASGYAEVTDIHLNDIPATQPEIVEIYDLLKGGVLI